jgi:hypothetical protein
MDTKKRWIVRIFIDDQTIERNPDFQTFLECFRYAGLIVDKSNNAISPHIDLACPLSCRSVSWAKMNAERMRTFGLNAIVDYIGNPVPVTKGILKTTT